MRLLQLRTIVVAHDLTPTSDAALQTGQVLAANAGAALHVAHVAPPSTAIIAKAGKNAEFLEGISAACAQLTVPYTPHVLEGEAPSAIASLADRISADVIIAGRRVPHAGVRMARPVGGTAYAVITRSRVPCLMVTVPLSLPLRRMVVAIDCSEASRGALLVGLSWSSALRDSAGNTPPLLTALHVHDEDRASEERAHRQRVVDHELDLLRRNAGAWAGVEVSGITRPGRDPAKAIASFVSEVPVNIIVLGTRGVGTAAEGTLGSVSAEVLSHATVPTLLVPPAVWRDHAKDMDYL